MSESDVTGAVFPVFSCHDLNHAQVILAFFSASRFLIFSNSDFSLDSDILNPIISLVSGSRIALAAIAEEVA